jgi:hypothetical protein
MVLIYKADSLQLKWVSHFLGKRESRGLVGDYIFTFNDARNPSKCLVSQSIFLTRITSEESVAKSLLPLLLPIFGDLSKKQQELIVSSCQKFEISEYQE